MNASVYCEKETKACRGREARMVAKTLDDRVRGRVENLGVYGAFLW
jgi:hypothetical protein